MMEKGRTLIFIPTYDERENVGPICEQIIALGLEPPEQDEAAPVQQLAVNVVEDGPERRQRKVRAPDGQQVAAAHAHERGVQLPPLGVGQLADPLLALRELGTAPGGGADDRRRRHHDGII